VTGQLLAEAFHRTGTAEAILFWILAPVAIGGAFGMVLSRNAVHAALWLVLVMFCLAVFYVAQDAPFLGLVQVIVYAGAIMVLFLFVIMLVGVDFSDSLVETLRGQRVAAVVLGLGFAGMLIFPIARTIAKPSSAAGLGEDGFNNNVNGIAKLLFTTYVWPFEVVSALLIVAAVGAMVLGHRERLNRRTQRQRSISRTRGLDGPVTTLPGPGVYALHDAVDRPALRPDGRPARNSVSAQYQGTINERLPVEYQREPDPLSPELAQEPPAELPAGAGRAGDSE
jgi:NADH-quinone oxidoreductase subunit J